MTEEISMNSEREKTNFVRVKEREIDVDYGRGRVMMERGAQNRVRVAKMKMQRS